MRHPKAFGLQFKLNRNLSQRSSHHEVHLRTTELRLARTSRRDTERPNDEYLKMATVR